MIQAERARRSLAEFTKQAWHIVEPTNPYISSWHLDALFDHLQAVSAGEIQDLLINMPPRHAKSIAVSVMWPVWDWITNPSVRWLYSSYSSNLSIRDSLRCRRLIQSPWYQRNFGDRFILTSDQNAKTRFDNDKTGYRIATSVGGLGTGEGGDRLVVDDPHNVKEAESDAVRESTLQWWDETMSTRGNNPKTVAKIIVMQRVHEKDLSGHVLEKGGYVHLCLPAEYESTRVVYSGGVQKEVPTKTVVNELGFVDPRTEDGTPLCPDRFGTKELTKLKVSLGSYGTACQLQQRPAPRGGGVFKSSWLGRYSVHPQIECRRIYGDTAMKTAERNDYSVFQCWGRGIDKRIYLLDQIRGKWEAYELEQKFYDFWNKHLEFEEFRSCRLSKALIEDKASGTGLIQSVRKKGVPIFGVQRSTDKLVRAYNSQPSLEAGLVCIPKQASWISDFTTEMDSFTKNNTHAHDDQLDPMMDAIEDLIVNKRINLYD